MVKTMEGRDEKYWFETALVVIKKNEEPLTNRKSCRGLNIG